MRYRDCCNICYSARTILVLVEIVDIPPYMACKDKLNCLDRVGREVKRILVRFR